MLVKWFVKEADSEKAISLRDRHVNGELELAAPALIVYEALNALKYTGLYSLHELKTAAVTIRNYGLALHEPDVETSELALEAAQANNITVYDGSYLGVAAKLEAQVITADKELIESLVGDYSKLAKHLSEV